MAFLPHEADDPVAALALVDSRMSSADVDATRRVLSVEVTQAV
jgi:hypothetical protein